MLRSKFIYRFFLCVAAIALNSSISKAAEELNSSIALEAIKECLDNRSNCIAYEDSVFQEAHQTLNPEEYAGLIFKTSLYHFKISNQDRAIHLLQQSTDLASRLDDKELLAQCKSRYSLVYFYDGNLDTALFLAKELLVYYQDKKDSTKIGRGYLYCGQIMREKGHYYNALESYIEALNLFRSLGDIIYEANVLSEMATLYAMSNENDKAIAYGRKSAALFNSLEDGQSEYAYVSLNLANNLCYAKKPDSAILILNRVIPIFIAHNMAYLHMNALAQLSRAYYIKGDLPLALATMQESNDIDTSSQFLFQRMYNFQLTGRMYSKLEDWKTALFYFNQSYVLHQKIGINDELKTLLLDLASAYDTLNQSDSALKFYKAYQTVADSLNSVEKENNLNELKEKYDADLKEEQLRNNAQEIALLEKSNTAKSQRNFTLVIILIAVLALTISIISRQRNSIKLKNIISNQKDIAHKAEIQTQTLERQKLEEDLNHRKRELANQALLIAEKNELLRSFRSEVEKVGEAETEAKRSLNSISRKMERAENQQGDWDKFMQLFKDVHPDLLTKLAQTHPELTHNDLRLLALMKMGFSNKEIADILHITEGGLKKARYRLRKKLSLEMQASIHQYIQNI